MACCTGPISSTANINNDLKSVSFWAIKWLMTLNADQTEVLTISTKNNKLSYPNLEMDGTILSEVPHHKHLGLTLSDNMSWTPHMFPNQTIEVTYFANCDIASIEEL